MIIKRYPNRKLYNTDEKRYITLDDVAGLIQRGEDVHVVDYASGEDLTAQILSQVIAGQEKKRSGFLPRPVLAGLVQAGGATLDGLRRAMLLPLDLLRNVDEEIQSRIERLIEKGEVTQEEGMHWLDRLLAVSPQSITDAVIEREIKKIMDEKGVITREELLNLTEQMDALSKKIDGLR